VAPGTEPVAWRLETDPPSPIPAGDYTLELSYTGTVRTSGEGLYVAPYDVDGRKEAMLDTQLEAIDARRLFPGFDEPSFRAVFEISVTAPARSDASTRSRAWSRGFRSASSPPRGVERRPASRSRSRSR
jgi:aminopeptidase N